MTDDPSRWMKKDTNYGYYSVLFSSGPLCVLLFGIAAFSKFNPLKGVRWLARSMVLLTILLNLLAYPTRGTLFFSIRIIDNGQWTMDNEGSWYDLGGRKLQGKPSKGGIYIRNGKKVATK